MKHKHTSKNKTYYENVLVLRIDSCDDRFGFMEYNEAYAKLTNAVNGNNPLFFEIYYDDSRKRIEDEVTLHTFDMEINGEKFISIDEVKKSESKGTMIASIMAVLIFLFTYWGSKRIMQRGIIV